MKISTEQQQKGASLVQTLTQKSWESAAFKEFLIKDPKAAIEEVTGKSLSGLTEKKIVVVDQTDESVVYINIPAQPNMDELELTEEQLEMVAGGITPTVAYVAGVGAGLAVCWLVDRYL